MSEYTSCLTHEGRFFVRYEDMYYFCGEDRQKQAAHRVLETKTNDRLTVLRETGQPIIEDNLWITLSWEDYVERSIHDAEQSSFRRMLPQIEKDGYVRSRYVKLDRAGQPIINRKSGKAYAWKTYQEAHADRTVDGLIMNQYLYLYQKVQHELNRLHGNVPPDGGGDGPDEEGATDDAINDRARGGNLRDASIGTSSVATSIPQSTLLSRTGVQNSARSTLSPETGTGQNGQNRVSKRTGTLLNSTGCLSTGTSLPCSNEQTPPVQKNNNKNLIRESSEESEKESPRISVAPVGAEVDGCSSFFENDSATPESCWSREGIANLAAVFLSPLPWRSREEHRKDMERWQLAIEKIYSSAVLGIESENERPIVLSNMLQFVMTEGSPSKYRANWLRDIKDIRRVKLWNIADNLFFIYKDLMKTGWKPQSETITAGDKLPVVSYPEPDRDPESVVTPEPENPIEQEALGAPVGYSREEATAIIADIRRERDGYFAECKPNGYGGYYVEAYIRLDNIHQITDQQQLEVFWERTRRRTLREVREEMEAKRQAVALSKVS